MTDQRVHGDYLQPLRAADGSLRVHGEYTQPLRATNGDQRVHGMSMSVLRSIATGTQQMRVNGLYLNVLLPVGGGGGGTGIGPGVGVIMAPGLSPGTNSFGRGPPPRP